MAINSDASHLNFSGLNFFTSIDRLGRFCNNLELYAELAFKHFIGDLIVSDAIPVQASFCLEIGPEFADSTEIAKLTNFLARATNSNGMAFGNLHTVRADYTAVTACVLGAGRNRTLPLPQHGKVFLSDSLGAFKFLVIYELDGREDESLSTFGKRSFLNELPPMVTAASDVTGFGLYGTLTNLADRLGLDIQIDLPSKIECHPDVTSIPISCLDRTMDREPSNNEAVSKYSLLHLAEVAGPTVLLCDSEDEFEFLKWCDANLNRTPFEIGLFRKFGSSGLGVIFK